MGSAGSEDKAEITKLTIRQHIVTFGVMTPCGLVGRFKVTNFVNLCPQVPYY